MKTIERQIIQCFIYILAKDFIVPGKINKILQAISEFEHKGSFEYTDQELADWASSKIREIECMF
uniref:Uncharacterized protein n=1 Tax=viral metagenome TaxID=1070528 RepID=A0A6M3LD66_9ZZZZ